ncbi:Transposase DDE domain protein [Planctomycetes bacterium Pan216]|uniref:Transposase DDE domain protein n=1 Tax=Kolteria novifilia TaxID=2527975 RepID=A0A518B8W3_9BACT|nr:Transposase DDE domain protein [Planctomycetes bacterium Pan216]
MSKDVRVTLEDVITHFEDLEDPRSTINQRHPLVSVVVIAVMGVLAGASGPTGIAKWARMKKELLLETLELPNGIPAKDVFRRVLAALRPDAFQSCFVSWLESLRQAACEEGAVSQPVFAVDGKTNRRSHDRKRGLGALHAVSLWASELGLSLGQVACEEKSNEITAIPELLRLVDLQGAIITIDAMGTQKAIAQQIVEGGADYVLAVKGNQESLETAIADTFLAETEDDFASGKVRKHETTETAHGRTTTRTYYQMPAPRSLVDSAAWAGLRTIGMVIAVCLRDGKETVEIRRYISSLGMGVRRFARAVRGHWGVENSCHWILDVVYREDDSRIRDQRARENFAWLDRFTLSLLKQHPSKDSIAMKRRSCGWSDDFLMEVLTGKAT